MQILMLANNNQQNHKLKGIKKLMSCVISCSYLGSGKM